MPLLAADGTSVIAVERPPTAMFDQVPEAGQQAAAGSSLVLSTDASNRPLVVSSTGHYYVVYSGGTWSCTFQSIETTSTVAPVFNASELFTAPTSDATWRIVGFGGGGTRTVGTFFTSSTTETFTGFDWTVRGNEGAGLITPKRGPLIKKSVRSSIKRALKLMANFGMEEEVKVFLGGNEIEVSHPESLLKFVISKGRYNIVSRTEQPGYSTPYKLSLYTKTNIHVADLCVYMENTPMLDQILALSMFVKTGDEEMILRKANFSRLCPDMGLRKLLATAHPVLGRKLGLSLAPSP